MFLISGATGEGTRALCQAVMQQIEDAPLRNKAQLAEAEVEVKPVEGVPKAGQSKPKAKAGQSHAKRRPA